MAIEILSIAVGLGLLMAFAYRGFPVVLFAPVFALIPVLVAGLPVFPTYTETFMGSASDYIKSFFPIFLLGAVFGKLMEVSGAASTIARTIVSIIGPRRAILAVVPACAVLTYGGVSLFVVAFSIYPMAAEMFREANIPKRLIPGAIALGAFTFTMDALPGSPQIQNIIPTRYFGTTIYAAPLLGLIGALMIFAGGMAWLEFRRRRAELAGEPYSRDDPVGTHVLEKVPGPSPASAIAPLALVTAANFVFSSTRFSIAGLHDASTLNKSFPNVRLEAVSSSWSLIAALTLGIGLTALLHWKRLKPALSKSLSLAVSGALLAIFNTASEVGFGNVVKTMPGFGAIREWVVGPSRFPLVSEAIAVNICAGITGSASGGLSIALEVMGKEYLEIARTTGISPETLHRIASMASGGMDTLPHNGAIITLLMITGLTHREAYPDIFAITIIKTLTVLILAFAVSIWS